MAISPTQQATKLIRELNFQYEITEHWNSFAKIRQDLFGIFDILVIVPDMHLVGLQVTTFSHRTERKQKIEKNEFIQGFLGTGNKAELWTFRETQKEKGFVFDEVISDQGNIVFLQNPTAFNWIKI